MHMYGYGAINFDNVSPVQPTYSKNVKHVRKVGGLLCIMFCTCCTGQHLECRLLFIVCKAVDTQQQIKQLGDTKLLV